MQPDIIVKKLLRTLVATSFFGLMALPAAADEIAELKRQLEILARRVEILEQERGHALPARAGNIDIDDMVTESDVSGSLKLPGTDTTMKIGGFIRAHMIHDFSPRPTSGGGDVAAIHRAILEGTPEFENRGDTRIAGRDARFHIATSTPSEFGKINTFIQADFRGEPDNKANRATSNRAAANIRHAYGEIGPFLFGQTNSNYMDNSVYPDKVNATGPTGRTQIRQGQLRYTHKLRQGREFAVALENPRGDFFDADDDNLHDGYPDLTVHYRRETEEWLYQFGAMLRRFGINDGLAGGARDSVTGWALNHSGMVLLPGGKDRLSWYVNLGDGIGRYLEGGRDQGASISPDGKLDTQFGYGGFVTYKHWWTEKLSTNFDFGAGFFELNPDEDAEANKKLLSSHLNLIWTPIDRLEFGIEYVWGRREVHDGRKGSVNRAQFNTVFFF